MLIAVDFDGTIVPDKFYPNKIPDEFMPGAKEALISLNAAGHTLVLWTLRDNGVFLVNGKPMQHFVTEQLRIALDFLNENGLDFFRLPCEFSKPNTVIWKFPADLYIDDKIPGGFQGWDFILSVLIPNAVGKPSLNEQTLTTPVRIPMANPTNPGSTACCETFLDKIFFVEQWPKKPFRG